MTKQKMIKLKLNVSIHGFKAGQIIDVAVDRENIPLDVNWRRRLRDATKDNCVEIVAEKQTAKKDDK